MIIDEIKEMEKYWGDLVYSVCSGNATEMASLKRFEIIDFFDYVTNKSKNG